MFRDWSKYQSFFLDKMLQVEFSLVEKVTLGTVLAALGICCLTANLGQDVGDYEKLQLVKLEAVQETVALRERGQ